MILVVQDIPEGQDADYKKYINPNRNIILHQNK